MLIALMMAKANGLNVPVGCWVALIAWYALELARAWFWTDRNE